MLTFRRTTNLREMIGINNILSNKVFEKRNKKQAPYKLKCAVAEVGAGNLTKSVGGGVEKML